MEMQLHEDLFEVVNLYLSDLQIWQGWMDGWHEAVTDKQFTSLFVLTQFYSLSNAEVLLVSLPHVETDVFKYVLTCGEQTKPYSH